LTPCQIASFIDGISVLFLAHPKRITITLGNSYSHKHSFNVIVQGVCKANKGFFFQSINAPKIGSQGNQNQLDMPNHLPHQCLVEDMTLDIKPNVHVDFTIVKFS
jgi:hypothetical protein